MAQFDYLTFSGSYGELSLVDPTLYKTTGHVDVEYARQELPTDQAKTLLTCKMKVYFRATQFTLVNVNQRQELEKDLQELVALYLRSISLGCPGIRLNQAKINYR